MTAGPHPDLDTLLAHADWVHRLSAQLCRDQHAAADAAQDTLLAAMHSPPRHADNLRGFFARTLRNVLHGRARIVVFPPVLAPERLLQRRLVPGDHELTITDSAGQIAQNRFTIAADDPAGREITIRQP